MMKQTVEAIRRTEREAQKIVEEASQTATEKRETAFLESKKFQEEAASLAEAKVVAMMDAAKAKGEAIVLQAEQDAEKEAKRLWAEASQKKAEAIQKVMQALL